MESEANQVSHTGSGTKKTRDTGVHRKKAAKPSPGSSGQSCRGRGGKSRVANAFHSAESSLSDTEGSVRVLRVRGAVAGRTAESKTVSQKTASGVHLRGRPAGSGSRNPPVRHATAKKSPTQRVSRHVPKRSNSRSNNRRLPTRAKPAIETLSCGEKPPAVRGSDRKKSRRQNVLRQEDVKEEDTAKEEEDDHVKNEESADVMVQSQDAEGDNAEAPAPRRRQKQQKVDKAPRPPKRRKKPPVQYVRCEMEGCGTVLAHPRYLQHHIKYQHLLKKTYVCDHPSCGRLFRLQKQLLRHAKHHTDQRDYICEYCARAFKSSHNLVVHRMIHTGEKPIQCEICGFTCRQKASLNWHMKKHDAEASYQFSCSVCGKKFEKKDSVVAHKSKSHPEVLIAEALAANGGSVIRSPISVQEAVPETPSEPTPSCVIEENQEVAGATLTPLQQVVLPLTPQTHLDSSQGPYLQLAAHQVMQVAPEPQAVLHVTSPSQLVQLSTLPHRTVSPAPPVLPQSSLITLSSVSSLAPQHATQWESEDNKDLQLPGEGELWNRVVVGNGSQDVGALMWEGNREMKREDEGIVWESERQVLLRCTEVQGDSLISRWTTTD